MTAMREIGGRLMDWVRALIEDTRQLNRDWPKIRAEINAYLAARRER